MQQSRRRHGLCLPATLPSRKASSSARHCDLHTAPRALRGLHSVPCAWKHPEPAPPHPPPPVGFRQELDWVLSYKHELVVAQTSACPGSMGVSGPMHSSSPKIQREGWCVVRGARAAALLHFPADNLVKIPDNSLQCLRGEFSFPKMNPSFINCL